MDGFAPLKNKINSKKAKICILGLGYVGLPLAAAFAERGFFIYGLDNNPSRIRKLKRGLRYIVDIDPAKVTSLIKKGKFFPVRDEKVLDESDVVIICVPTPLRKVKIPDISFVVKATETIKNHLHKGQLVILESTSYPATTREVVLPILKKSGLEEGKDFFLCFSPERVNPGDKKFPLPKIPKIVGGLSQKATLLAKALYSKIIRDIFSASSPEVAETAKLLENTYRLINIALVNEFAVVCNKLGISVWEVIKAARTKPFGFMPFYPGPGIGGHCLPCDPLYLSWKAKKLGFKTKMIDLASYLNHSMPGYIVQRVRDLLGKKGKNIDKAKVLILGVTYKKDVKDLRESPALDIIEEFQKKGAKVSYYDPLIPYIKINSINLKRAASFTSEVKKCDCIVIVTDHSRLDYEAIRKKANLIFDARNVFNKKYDNIEAL